jgi:hypothetical protein
MTILQPLFGNLKRYRRDHGKVMLYLIQNYLSDGRLVQIVGDEGAQYVPLMRNADVKYDIVVDDMPTSPNQKEMTWAFLKELWPTLPPQIQLALADVLPIPQTTIEKIKEAAATIGEDPAAEKMQQLEAMLAEAKVMLTQAQARKAIADAGESDADAQLKTSQIGQPVGVDGVPDKGIDYAAQMQKLRAETGVKREKIGADVQVARERMAVDAKNAERDAQVRTIAALAGLMKQDTGAQASNG